MYHRDYIIRIIQELAQALAEVAGLRRLGNYLEALGIIDRTMVRMAGLGSALVSGLSVDDMLRMLHVGEYLDRGKVLALAELLAEEAGIYAALGREDVAVERSLRSLRLYLEALDGEDPATQQGFLARIEARLAGLEHYALPARVRQLLFRYYEGVGRYAQAEDVLYELLDAGERGMRGEGIAFYRRLLARPDVMLEMGGLPRAEVLDGLAELQAGQS